MAITGPCTNPSHRKYIPLSGYGQHNHTTISIATREARYILHILKLLIQVPVVPLSGSNNRENENSIKPQYEQNNTSGVDSSSDSETVSPSTRETKSQTSMIQRE
ncbi:hypothetical protein AVEN_203110-1 [Araneus ventricosus]|uniref:Uncharacterized protein n=1 Tax=Araneus ventricosus TaxID=182803 RepID=A0A4Y2DTB0_ARAVE|nr:hypothetical protein AVEN_203110-1 [Araneus ventricosus]